MDEQEILSRAVEAAPADSAPKLAWADLYREMASGPGWSSEERKRFLFRETGLRFAAEQGKMPSKADAGGRPWRFQRLIEDEARRRAAIADVDTGTYRLGEGRSNELHEDLFDFGVPPRTVMSVEMRASFPTLADAFHWLGLVVERRREADLQDLIHEQQQDDERA